MKFFDCRPITQGVLLGVALSLISCTPKGDSVSNDNLKVAFVGDSTSGSNFRRVLRLINNQGAHMVLHQGDLGYEKSNAAEFITVVNEVLGPDFPYFASRGNHEPDWEESYQPILARRAKDVGALCSGDYGQNSACKYRGLFFILSAGGEKNSERENTEYIEDQIAADKSMWRICSWHRNQKRMQPGSKSDEVGWGPYEACREGGAIIATGHAHVYARTRTLTNAKRLTVDPNCSAPTAVCVRPKDRDTGKPGSTFVFVAGLGGRNIKPQLRCMPTTFPYGQEPGCNGIWASIYSASQDAKYGALFITFNVAGDPNKAKGEFINIDGQVIDSFTITARSSSSL